MTVRLRHSTCSHALFVIVALALPSPRSVLFEYAFGPEITPESADGQKEEWNADDYPNQYFPDEFGPHRL
jgi:hypothetical protein